MRHRELTFNHAEEKASHAQEQVSHGHNCLKKFGLVRTLVEGLGLRRWDCNDMPSLPTLLPSQDKYAICVMDMHTNQVITCPINVIIIKSFVAST